MQREGRIESARLGNHKQMPRNRLLTEWIGSEVVPLRRNRVNSLKHPSLSHTHTRTLTHSKCGRVSGCASKIASDTKTSLVPKEGGEVEPS